MKIVLAMRYIERDGRQVLQQRVGELVLKEAFLIQEYEAPGMVVRVPAKPAVQLQLDADPVWQDVPLELA